MQKRKVPSFFFARQTGEAQDELDGTMTPVSSISLRISSSASLAAIGGRRGDCLIGRASPVSMSCSTNGQNSRSVDEEAKVSWVITK